MSDLNNLYVDIKKAIGEVAAEYAYAKALKDKIDQISKTTLTKKDIRKALHVLRWLSRSERKVDRVERQIITYLQSIKDASSQWQGQEEQLLTKLKITQASLLKKASFYTGELRSELLTIETYDELRIKFKDNPAKLKSIEENLTRFTSTMKDSLESLLQWTETTQVLLDEAAMLTKDQMSRRRFLRVGAAAAAATAVTLLGTAANGQKNITIYLASAFWCKPCQQLKKRFLEAHVPYMEVKTEVGGSEVVNYSNGSIESKIKDAVINEELPLPFLIIDVDNNKRWDGNDIVTTGSYSAMVTIAIVQGKYPQYGLDNYYRLRDAGKKAVQSMNRLPSPEIKSENIGGISVLYDSKQRKITLTFEDGSREYAIAAQMRKEIFYIEFNVDNDVTAIPSSKLIAAADVFTRIYQK